jgi:hypothetical protein
MDKAHHIGYGLAVEQIMLALGADRDWHCESPTYGRCSATPPFETLRDHRRHTLCGWQWTLPAIPPSEMTPERLPG